MSKYVSNGEEVKLVFTSENADEDAYVTPQWVAENGTPIDDYGEDMVLKHVEIDLDAINKKIKKDEK